MSIFQHLDQPLLPGHSLDNHNKSTEYMRQMKNKKAELKHLRYF